MKLFDKFLIISFYFFSFIALIFEPLYYLGCNWNYNNCIYSTYNIVKYTSKLWFIYIKLDPLFYNIPLWLQIMCYIEVFIFGPLYFICAYGLQYKLKWLPYIALPFCGALFYSTIVYFGMELIDTLPGTNMTAVILINIPWSILPILLTIRVLQDDFKLKKE